MHTFREGDYTVNICTDIIEWAKEFYGMPDNATIHNKQEVESECMGFAQIDDKEIWVFVPNGYNKSDLSSTIAHEIGHITELKYPENPEQIEGNDSLHELKANHYESFYVQVNKILELSEAIHHLNKNDSVSLGIKREEPLSDFNNKLKTALNNEKKGQQKGVNNPPLG